MTTVTQLHPEPTFEQLRERWPVKRRGDRQRGQRLWDEITSGEGLHTNVFVKDTNEFEPRHWMVDAKVLYDASRAYLDSCLVTDSYKYEYLALLDNMLNRGLWDNFR